MIERKGSKYQFGDRNIADNNYSSTRKIELKESHPERKITLIILVITFILCGVFWLKTELKNNNINLFESYTFEIIKNQPVIWRAKDKEEVLKKIEEYLQPLMGRYAVYVYAFSRAEGYGINQNEIFPAASINKIPIMLAFYQAIEKGDFSENTEYQLKKDDIQDYGTGSMRYEEPGKTYTYGELLRLAGRQSDNTAGHVLANLLGMDKIQKFIENLGLDKTSMENNNTTPEELSRLWEMVYKGQILKTEKIKNQFYTDLENTDFEDRLAAGLPKGTSVAHKVGSAERAYHDCGLVFAKNPFVICVMSKDASEDEAVAVIPKIAKVVWEFEEK